MQSLFELGDGFERHTEGEILRIEAWGPHAIRVRSAATSIASTLPGALDQPAPGATPQLSLLPDDGARLVNGRITADVEPNGRIRFLHTASGRELVAEKRPYTAHPGPRVHAARGDGSYRLELSFEAYDDERVYGLGQHLHGRLDQKGCVIDLIQANTVVTIPFLHSSRGYGLLWNNPALGRVELGADATRWVADSAHQIDYWITAGDTPAEIMTAYADATGYPPMPPEWALGFWQSKLRYQSQDELLAVAREYAERGLPLSVIVCDFFHWPHMGDWRFDPEFWPDPAGMTAELDRIGVKLAVSVWPTVDPAGDNYDALRAAGHLVRARDGGLLTFSWPTKGPGNRFQQMAYYDATSEPARGFLWEQLREHYHDLGVAAYWLDSCEPDFTLADAARAQYAAGPGTQVGNLYPLLHSRGVYEGQRQAGIEHPLTLIRGAWAGSQRYGTALWSGDIPPTFDSLARQLRAGLNVALSGIPWWHTDIGGFQGGDPNDPGYREVMIRWFQYGTFSPIMRLHGDREPNQPFSASMTGGPNEVWSYGDEAYEIMREHLLLRERLRPYLTEQATAAQERGTPPMRPLLFDFPGDERAWTVDDQHMLGPDILVAPVTHAGARTRTVYLPKGTAWLEPTSGTVHDGGHELEADAPLARIPVFLRAGTPVAVAFTAGNGPDAALAP